VRTDKLRGQLITGINEVGQVEIDPSALLGQRDPVHHGLDNTISHDPDADGGAIKIPCRFEDFIARTGIIQIDADDNPHLAVRIGIGHIGFVLGLELWAGKVAAVANLSDEGRQEEAAFTKRKVGLPK